MTPADFPQGNTVFQSPQDLEGSCQPIRGLVRQVQGGIWDGTLQVIVAWQPSAEDLKNLNAGGSVFLSVMGGLPPHYLSTTFAEAIQ